MTSDGYLPSEWLTVVMWNWTQHTWHVLRNCPTVLSDVPDTHKVKESAQQADGWAQQEAVLQAVEAPVRCLRVHTLYAVGNLRAHRWRWNWASVSGRGEGIEDASAAIYLWSCGRRSTHQSHKVGTSWVPQEVDDCDLESFGRWPSVWYDNVLKWKGTKKQQHSVGLKCFPPPLLCSVYLLFMHHSPAVCLPWRPSWVQPAFHPKPRKPATRDANPLEVSLINGWQTPEISLLKWFDLLLQCSESEK